MNLLYVVESGDYKYLVFDEMPDKISTKYGDDTIIGRIGGIFYDLLAANNIKRFGLEKQNLLTQENINKTPVVNREGDVELSAAVGAMKRQNVLV